MRGTSVLAFVAAAGLASAASAVTVDVELALLVDISGSIDTNEYNLQRQGYASAFSNPNFYSNTVGAGNSIAVNLVYWSGSAQQSMVVPWTVIDSQASANAFAAAVLAAPRPFSGNTAPGSAINFAVSGPGVGNFGNIFNNGIDSNQQIIDVSGDGEQNEGANTAAARAAALAAGVDRINGLVIGGGASLLNWYQNNVQGGTGSFTLQANSFADFANAVEQKIQIELRVIPLPGPAMMGLAGMGVLCVGRRRRA